jgi:hypothetical protein
MGPRLGCLRARHGASGGGQTPRSCLPGPRGTGTGPVTIRGSVNIIGPAARAIGGLIVAVVAHPHVQAQELLHRQPREALLGQAAQTRRIQQRINRALHRGLARAREGGLPALKVRAHGLNALWKPMHRRHRRHGALSFDHRGRAHPPVAPAFKNAPPAHGRAGGRRGGPPLAVPLPQGSTLAGLPSARTKGAIKVWMAHSTLPRPRHPWGGPHPTLAHTHPGMAGLPPCMMGMGDTPNAKPPQIGRSHANRGTHLGADPYLAASPPASRAVATVRHYNRCWRPACLPPLEALGVRRLASLAL